MNRFCFSVLACLVVFISFPCMLNADAFHVQGYVDPDNVHVFFTGDYSGSQLTYRGQGWGPYGGTQRLPAGYDFTTSDVCFYLVAWSDDVGFQGLLHDLSIDGNPIWFNDSRWEVYPTGNDRDDYLSLPAPTTQEVAAEVQIAIAQGAWVPVTIGTQNDGTYPNCPGTWILPSTPNINTQAWWAWYDSGNCSHGCQPFAGDCNHNEYLIFRLCLTPPVQTEPSTWGRMKALYDN